MQLIIAGFHRSGTSALTQLLHSAGLHVGDRLLGAMPSNPYGHFEDRDFLELHRSIFAEHGDDWQWDSSFPFYVSSSHWRQMRALVRKRDLNHASWGFKDPRACLLLGHWKYLMPDSRVVIVFRDPGDSVRSMEVRHARALLRGEGNAAMHRRFFEEPDHGFKLWDSYNRKLIAFAEAHLDDCMVIPFRYLKEGRPVVSMINSRFSGDLREIDTSATFDTTVTSSDDRAQRVHSGETALRVEETYQRLVELTGRTNVREGRESR